MKQSRRGSGKSAARASFARTHPPLARGSPLRTSRIDRKRPRDLRFRFLVSYLPSKSTVRHKPRFVSSKLELLHSANTFLQGHRRSSFMLDLLLPTWAKGATGAYRNTTLQAHEEGRMHQKELHRSLRRAVCCFAGVIKV